MLGMHWGCAGGGHLQQRGGRQSADRAPETRYCLHRYPDARTAGIDPVVGRKGRHLIILLTAHNEYMLQALQHSAADYLLEAGG